MSLTFTILGCGSSGGVPRPGFGWGACDPAEPRNRRRRCSLMVERHGPQGTTRLIVDTSPDLREQLLDAEVDALDAVLFSHDHADHTHGIDDLRALVLHRRRRIPVFADAHTRRSLTTRFGYLFETPPGSLYPPILEIGLLEPGLKLAIEGPAGLIEAWPFAVEHGPGYGALGFRFGGVAYVPDVSALPPAAEAQLLGLDVLILDALRPQVHPSHFNLDEALATIARVKPGRAILTNLHSDLDYATLAAALPAGVEPAHDGLRFEA